MHQKYIHQEDIYTFESMDTMQPVRAFNGTNCDVGEWLEKMKLVAKLKKIQDVSTLLPLYLEGPAFAVYNQLSSTDKAKSTSIETALEAAFGKDQFDAYDLFKKRTWMPGESVEVYLADLRQLARTAKVETTELVFLAFVTGLPKEVANQLRASELRKTHDLEKATELARILVASYGVAGLVAKQDPVSQKKWKCYLCQKEHPTVTCSLSKPGVCWKCGQKGHMINDCTNKKSRSGNEKEVLPAPTTPQ